MNENESLPEKNLFWNHRFLRNSKGIALLQAMFLVMLITFIVNQVNFEAAVEYTINSQTLHRVKAYQAAKAGMELSLLRIKIYNQVVTNPSLKDNEEAAAMLKMIYSLPLSWPMVIPGEASTIDKDAMNKLNKESLMDTTYSTQIQSEDLLNINDLNSPSDAQKEKIRTKLQDLFKAKLEDDKEWGEKNRGIAFDEIINNIQDWIDPDTESKNGGNESSIYGKLRELDPDNKDNFPPNRFFRTIDEVRMVPGVTDDIFELIKPAFSVFGISGIDPNSADQGALKSLHKSITDEIASKIIARRDNSKEGGPFKDKDDFIAFIEKEGARLLPEDKDKMPIRLPSTNPCSFRIQSTGSSGKSVITITAVTYDLACAQQDIAKLPVKEGGASATATPTPSQTANPQQQLPKGPPHIVYWNEK